MLRGEKIILRARHEDDVALLEENLYADVAEVNRTSGQPWWPLPPGSQESHFRIREGRDTQIAAFSVVAASNGELVGDCVLWGIDRFHRSAHLGLSLFPAFRGKGLGTEVVQLLCEYAFLTLGLHRLQLETLADNDGMRKTAERTGFELEGQFRKAAWANGEFIDEVVYGLLAPDWQPNHA
jgi:RimJ/RimL family protein N-acetyltransferase